MLDQTKVFFQRSKKVAEDFLQTTVIVDDQIFFKDSSKPMIYAAPTDGLAEPGRKGSATSSAKSNVDEDKVEILIEEEGSHSLDAQKVINSFAERRIVCSVIKPSADDDWKVSIKKLASTVDVVILDWDINKDNGDDTKELLGSILQSANQEPGQLKLLVIYTGENGIAGISDEIKEEIEKKLGMQVVTEENTFTFVSGSMRVVIFSKPGTKNLPEEYEHRIVRFEELADRVISEFAIMTAGLVSNTVLHSLTQIRLNTYKLLNTFSRTLNAPYLTHRALLPNPEDAETLLSSLIAKEIQGIIEESNVGLQGGLVAIREWLSSQDAPIVIDFNLLDQRILFDSPDKIGLLLEKGIHKTLKDKDCLTSEIAASQHDKIIRELEKKAPSLPWTQSFGKNENTDNFSDDKFAHISIMRSYYEKTTPKLTLGTILRKIDDNAYWLCLQPRCDCVRIENSRAFPFISLKNGNQKFSLVIADNGAYVRLLPSYKPFALKMFTFVSKPEHRGEIVASIEDSSYCFIDNSNIQYKWLGELKSEHAQRIANEFAANLSRVGLDESEWLRLWATKG